MNERKELKNSKARNERNERNERNSSAYQQYNKFNSDYYDMPASRYGSQNNSGFNVNNYTNYTTP